MAGSGKPVLLSAGSWGGQHHPWSAPPQAVLRFPHDGWLWQPLPGLRMQEVLGHGVLPSTRAHNLQIQAGPPAVELRLLHPKDVEALSWKSFEKPRELYVSWCWGSHLQPPSLGLPHLWMKARSPEGIVQRPLQCLYPESKRVRERLKIEEREDEKWRPSPKRRVEGERGADGRVSLR